jgi:hypothetical protein
MGEIMLKNVHISSYCQLPRIAFFVPDLGKPSIKSIDIKDHSISRIGKGDSNPR